MINFLAKVAQTYFYVWAILKNIIFQVNFVVATLGLLFVPKSGHTALHTGLLRNVQWLEGEFLV